MHEKANGSNAECMFLQFCGISYITTFHKRGFFYMTKLCKGEQSGEKAKILHVQYFYVK